MACSRWRCFRGWAGAISFARSARSGSGVGPARRRTSGAARSSRSDRRGHCRSTRMVRSPDACRSPCAAAQARYACSRNFARDVQPRAQMDPEAAQRPGDLSFAERAQQALRSGEWGDLDVYPTDLDRPVRVTPDPTGKIVFPGELEGSDVTRRCDLARVEDLDDVESQCDAFERPPTQMPAAIPTEWVR